MGLAETDPAIEEQRVEGDGLVGRGAGLGDAPSGGVGQLIRLADDEVLEGEARIERGGKMTLVIRDLDRRLRRAGG